MNRGNTFVVFWKTILGSTQAFLNPSTQKITKKTSSTTLLSGLIAPTRLGRKLSKLRTPQRRLTYTTARASQKLRPARLSSLGTRTRTRRTATTKTSTRQRENTALLKHPRRTKTPSLGTNTTPQPQNLSAAPQSTRPHQAERPSISEERKLQKNAKR